MRLKIIKYLRLKKLKIFIKKSTKCFLSLLAIYLTEKT